MRTPVLVVYGVVGRWTLTDLQPDRPLIRPAAAGADVYFVDWGKATRADRWRSLDDYVGDCIDACVDHIRAETGTDKVNLLGDCVGGVFTQCYAALFDDKVRPDRHHHAHRLPCRSAGGSPRPRFHQPVDAQARTLGH